MFYESLLNDEEKAIQREVRNLELDAASQDGNAEKCYTDEDMWQMHEE